MVGIDALFRLKYYAAFSLLECPLIRIKAGRVRVSLFQRCCIPRRGALIFLSGSRFGSAILNLGMGGSAIAFRSGELILQVNESLR